MVGVARLQDDPGVVTSTSDTTDNLLRAVETDGPDAAVSQRAFRAGLMHLATSLDRVQAAIQEESAQTRKLTKSIGIGVITSLITVAVSVAFR